MTTAKAPRPPCRSGVFRNIVCGPSPAAETLGFPRLRGISVAGLHRSRRNLVLRARSKPIKVKENATVSASLIDDWFKPITAKEDSDAGKNLSQMSNVANSTNIMWHDCPIQKQDRQQLLQQKGCVIWLTGLSGSGKSTIACALSRSLHSKGKLSYILDGDNIRHGLNQDLSFRAEDRSENIRRIGEVAKLFADAGVICITSLISPYQKDRDACRALMPKGDFIEVFIDVPLHVCEARDPKGLYKLARAGKIKDSITTERK
ncbi:Adenylyl-sulfate kinase, chloroplastic isoform C [Glycine soja]|uniref:Adenylyl-sulfate kinase n=1 Tax=Glycine soja TaxID=3848 RepID=A0A445KM80_GLYSO|nr:Adenylyl-sulfate kinase, chloroplastic isoform C [Glycine soja]